MDRSGATDYTGGGGQDKSILTEDVIQNLIYKRRLSPSTLTSLHPDQPGVLQAESLNLMVLVSAFCCLDPVLSVVTSLDNKSPFLVTQKMKELGQAVDRLASDTVSEVPVWAGAVQAGHLPQGPYVQHQQWV